MMNGQSKKDSSPIKKPLKELHFATEEDFWAWVKKTQTPKQLAEMKATYKRFGDPTEEPSQITVYVDADGKAVLVSTQSGKVVLAEKPDKPEKP